MSLYTLKYRWMDHEGSLSIENEGTLYLDLSEPRVRAYAKPADGPMAILTVSKKKLFLVYEGRALELGPEWQAAGAFQGAAERKEEFAVDYRKVLNLVLPVVRRYWKKPAVLGGGALVFIVLLLVFAFSSKENTSQTKGQEMEFNDVAPDLSASDLALRRLQLAENYLKEKNPALSLDLADKVLALWPDNRKAMEIKDAALALQDKAKTESQRVLKRELHLKSLLDEATDLMARSDYLGARLVVEQILTEDPKNADAYRMGEEVKKQLAKIDEEKNRNSLSDEQKAGDAERLWQNGKALFDEKKYTEAWALLHEASGLVDTLKIEPVFRLDLKEALGQTEDHLNEVVRPLVEKARQKRNAGDAAADLEQIRLYQEALGGYFEAKTIFADYPLLKQETDLTIQSLDKAIGPHFVEAQTILGLEGCCAAEPYFQKIMTLAKYDKVSQYMKAKQFLEQCPCR